MNKKFLKFKTTYPNENALIVVIIHRTVNEFFYVSFYKYHTNESDIAIKTSPFQEKDNCACSYRRRKVLGMHAISVDTAKYVREFVTSSFSL